MYGDSRPSRMILSIVNVWESIKKIRIQWPAMQQECRRCPTDVYPNAGEHTHTTTLPHTHAHTHFDAHTHTHIPTHGNVYRCGHSAIAVFWQEGSLGATKTSQKVYKMA